MTVMGRMVLAVAVASTCQQMCGADPLFYAPAGGAVDAAERISRLTGFWRWKEYWLGENDLGSRYKPGMGFRALIFWPRQAEGALGFCSVDLGVCRYYQTMSSIVRSKAFSIPAGLDLVSAFDAFLLNTDSAVPVFLRREYARGTVTMGRKTSKDFVFEVEDIPSFRYSGPVASTTQQVRPDDELNSLTRLLACRGAPRTCRTELLVPFYSERDPMIPVYRKCSDGCEAPFESILYPKLFDGRWSLGATNIDSSKGTVNEMKRKIRHVLMRRIFEP